MKTKSKAIRRIPSVSSPLPLDMSPGVQRMLSKAESCEKKRPLYDNMALDTRPDNINKKLCIEQSRLPQQWALETPHIPSKQNTTPGNVTSTRAFAASSSQPQQPATSKCRTVTSMENSGAMQGSGLLLFY